MKRRWVILVPFLMAAVILLGVILIVSRREPEMGLRFGTPFKDKFSADKSTVRLPLTNTSHSKILWTITYDERPMGSDINAAKPRRGQIIVYHMAPGEWAYYHIKVLPGMEYHIISRYRPEFGTVEKRLRSWCLRVPMLKRWVPDPKLKSVESEWLDLSAIGHQQVTNAPVVQPPHN